MDRAHLMKLIEEALEAPTASITEDTQIEDVEEWDSLGWLNIIATMDDNLHIRVEAKELSRHRQVGALVDYLESRLSKE